MPSLPSIGTLPASTRVFAGYRLPNAQRATFLKELGKTFMPGTPNMLAPLGLGAYVPAFLDPQEGSNLPDEVALIIYASGPVYDAARNNSLRGRMYTHSHAGVFDMKSSGGQFPKVAPEFDTRPDGRKSWCVWNNAVDWQRGATRLLAIEKQDTEVNVADTVFASTIAQKEAMEQAGIDQAIAVGTEKYAAVWVHTDQAELKENLAPLVSLVPAGCKLVHNLQAQPIHMINGDEGPDIQGPGLFSFRFVRDLRFFLE
jgi:hypothetical protein